ncbi:MAG TPA: glycine cleavage system protein GcvH [Spirochaetota bacterium]
MSTIPQDLRYTKDHEWIRIEGENIGVCGITFHAQQLLTDVVFVELPEIGKTVKAGERVAVVESVKAVSDIYSPTGGRIIEANKSLEENPGLINSDPYGKGWIFRIGIDNIEDLDSLMDASSYEKHIESGK